jgi:hypothetical protein
MPDEAYRFAVQAFFERTDFLRTLQHWILFYVQDSETRKSVLRQHQRRACYTQKRQDDEYFGGLREQVLERDGYCYRVCGVSGRRKRSIVVHHRVPGKSVLNLMISLCPGCHAKGVAQKSFFHRCHRFCANCGANNSRSAMSKPH